LLRYAKPGTVLYCTTRPFGRRLVTRSRVPAFPHSSGFLCHSSLMEFIQGLIYLNLPLRISEPKAPSEVVLQKSRLPSVVPNHSPKIHKIVNTTWKCANQSSPSIVCRLKRTLQSLCLCNFSLIFSLRLGFEDFVSVESGVDDFSPAGSRVSLAGAPWWTPFSSSRPV
jgi:hypothetical protein